MQLANQAQKIFYLSCLVLLLGKLANISQPQRDFLWQRSGQILSKLYGQGHLGQFETKGDYTHSSASPSGTLKDSLRDRNFMPTIHGTQPLAMRGGDPYIRALMRTITASEANVSRPYNVIYGGKQVEDLSNHPQLCVTIVAGPNIGNCTTAAGRYQMLDFTWNQTARQYHPHPSGFWRWKSYSFEAKYQDAVVYAWLSDSQAWDVDIADLLRQGEITQVLQLLSGTWTSLGYGIETNSMSNYLPQIYQNMLQQELS